ncbi:hypothetical protein [Kutzneria sp. CA-103260]|uniref:hypothetical protein n=1 Tax=Kutzneria sp. CA-103260 TaxID=2802641 RepID=UPI001BA5736C|nr:hypothetical protein [Kutzneria sp. CA-103260]QUQ69780.1 hypothetical protein JJ691_75420 [Kutzneria sp. CA-103260]
MNIEELESAVAAIGIPARMVAAGGHAQFSWSVEQAEDGAWEVYWLERGDKNDLERFADENQACTYLLGRLTYSQILAGLKWSDAQ